MGEAARQPNTVVAQLLARQASDIARAEAILAKGGRVEFSLEAITPDHPLAKAMGYEAARAIFDTPGLGRSKLAAHRRAEVERLSLAGYKVRDIAAELGLNYRYVVQLRADLGVGRRRCIAMPARVCRLPGTSVSDVCQARASAFVSGAKISSKKP